MNKNPPSTPVPTPAETPADYLRQEYDAWQALFHDQPIPVQRFLEAQARGLAEALTYPERSPQVRFTLPNQVVLAPGGKEQTVPAEHREQLAGGLRDRLAHGGVAVALRERLAQLEGMPDRAVAVGAGLLRHATAMHMVHGMLPAGRSVTYRPLEGEEIPSQPVEAEGEPASAITAPTDAIAEEAPSEEGRGELLVPFVPAARRFYLPQWVAFDDEDRLLVASASEAEAHIASMQRFLSVLHAAIGLAPHMVADEGYQQKRHGMLGQLVNQGRALARHHAREVVRTVQQRAAAGELNRGLALSLPYFDDQALRMKTHDFEVIPSGRIMFVPAFVVRAAHQERAKVAQDTRLSPSTRKHLLAELTMLERAFEAKRDG